MTFLQLLSRTDGGKERFQKSITNLSLTRHKKKKQSYIFLSGSVNNFPVDVGCEGAVNADDFLLQPRGCQWIELDS